jgi:hypothetical protein
VTTVSGNPPLPCRLLPLDTFIEIHRRIDRSQAGHQIVPYLISQRVGVPYRAIQQMLERARGDQPGVLGQTHEFFFGTSASNAHTINPNVTFGFG